jgi:hypothetical protein
MWDTPICWFDTRYMKVLTALPHSTCDSNSPSIQLFFVEGLFLGPTQFFPKAAIMLLYLQLFSVHKAMRTAVYIGLLAILLTYLPWIPLAIYFSTPRQGQTWEDLIILRPQEKVSYYGVVQGALSVLIDIYIFILPLPILARLDMAFAKKVQIVIVFSTAFM